MAQCLLAQGVFAPIGESFDFGIEAVRSDQARSWFVCLSDRSLEIFSSYDPSPSYVEQDGGEPFGPAFWHMVKQEDWFIWDANKPHDTPYDVSRWVEEVTHPERYRFEGFILEPDVYDTEYTPDPSLTALFDQVTTRVDEHGVVHIDLPPELQALFDHIHRES